MIDPDSVPILAAMLPGGEARFWSSRAVIDPRVTPTEISRRTGLSRSTVQNRIRGWRQRGFLSGSEVWPNPKLLGAHLATIDTTLGPGVAVDGVLESLSKIEGVLSARDYLDEHGRSVRIYVADDGPTGLERRTRLIQHLSGSSRRLTAEPHWIPDPPSPLTALDWKIIACARAYPEDSLVRASTRLRVSPRTLARRRDRLIDAHALWWLLTTDNSKLPVADFFVRLRDPSRFRDVRNQLDREIDGWIPCAPDGFGEAPGRRSDLIAGLAFVDSPAVLDGVARRLATLAGVESVHWRIPCGLRSFPEWFDRGIRAHLGPSSTSSVQSSPSLAFAGGSFPLKLPSLPPVSFGVSSGMNPNHLPNARNAIDSPELSEGTALGTGRRR